MEPVCTEQPPPYPPGGFSCRQDDLRLAGVMSGCMLAPRPCNSEQEGNLCHVTHVPPPNCDQVIHAENCQLPPSPLSSDGFLSGSRVPDTPPASSSIPLLFPPFFYPPPPHLLLRWRVCSPLREGRRKGWERGPNEIGGERPARSLSSAILKKKKSH